MKKIKWTNKHMKYMGEWMEWCFAYKVTVHFLFLVEQVNVQVKT